MPSERNPVLVEAAGGPEAYEAYLKAGEALHAFARHIPGALGHDVALVYYQTTRRLQEALGRQDP